MAAVRPENALEVWERDDKAFIYWVLEKYPIQEGYKELWYTAANTIADEQDPFEYGDDLAEDVMRYAHKLEINPLTGKRVGGDNNMVQDP